MSDIVHCPECQRQVRVPASLIGKLVKCPSCGAKFQAGESREYASPPPPARRDVEEVEEDYEEEYRPRRRRRYRDLKPHRGTTVLVLGILSLVVAPIILGPIAWVMGNNDLREIRAGRMDPEGEGNTNAGRICGMIGTILGILGCVFAIFWLFLMFAFMGAAGGFR